MERLWEARKRYLRFDPAEHSIAQVCSPNNKFVPYHRKYGALTPKQLLSLIADAKRLKWQALDLTNCGLSQLPDELWELSELKILYLGNKFQMVDISVKSDPEGKEPETLGEEDDARSIYADNTFHVLPQGLERLKNLQVLSIEGSCLLDRGEPPPSMNDLSGSI